MGEEAVALARGAGNAILAAYCGYGRALDQEELEDEGAMALALSLLGNTTLLTLDLSGM